ncbi:MAG: hypothetical protein M5U27_14200 [Gaiella sp.]|nr:hypothetical protein [Gaiella sp.]
MTITDHVHSVSAFCAATAADAFAFVADASRLGEWALGCWNTVESSAGVVEGTSLFDGGLTYARADPDRSRMIVDFDVGDEPTALVRRITVRVVRGDDIGRPAETSLLVLTGWRTASMDDERWRRLAVAHEAEILLLRHRIEASSG